MSTPNPSPAFANLEQQHKLAKDLLRAAHDGDVAALARIGAVRGDAGSAERPLQLADAQPTLAREAGFDSWPKLVADFHERDFAAFAQAVQGGDTARVRLLLALEHVRARVNEPTFAFGQRAAHSPRRTRRCWRRSRSRRRRQPEERVGERPLHRARVAAKRRTLSYGEKKDSVTPKELHTLWCV